MFVNHEGYDLEGDNDDCYWYYENGVSLDSFNCWDATDTMGSLLNTKMITYQTGDFGKNALQTWNSYGVLDNKGDELDSARNSWELSATLDSAVFAFPKVRNGVTKNHYEIDLKNVKITPAFSGNTVYAFMGYYMWQDYYVINIGIACDTATGNWYPYIGTSRDDSASDTVYATEGCVMTSTWNDEQGCFIPDAESVTLDIETKWLEDDEGFYQVNDFIAKTNQGATYSRRITDSTVNSFFPGRGLGLENSYIFIAGLDVKQDISLGNYTKPVDFFNGAKFENLTVTKAEAYVPTEEELSQDNYGFAIELERGKTYNILMAAGGSAAQNYSILNNNVCSSYTKGDGKDIYTFDFNKYAQFKPESSPSYSATTSVYQDQIDLLKGVTNDNIMDLIDLYRVVEEIYGEDAKGTGSILEDKIKVRNVLNFQPFLAAKEVVTYVMQIDEATQAVVDQFKALPSLGAYVMKGWTGTGEGYLYSDILKMREIKAAFDALEAEMKIKIFFHVKQSAWDDWMQLSDDIDAIMTHANFTSAPSKTAYACKEEGGGFAMGVHNTVTLTPDTAMKQIAYWTLIMKNKYGAAFNWDYYQPYEYILTCVDYLKANEIPIPAYYTQMLDRIGFESFIGDYRAFQTIITLGSYWDANETNLTVKHEITEAQAELLTQYFSSTWKYTHLSWFAGDYDGGAEWTQGRVAQSLKYFITAGSNFTTFKDCAWKVIEVLESHGYTMLNKYQTNEAVIEPKAGEELSDTDLTQEGQDFYNAYKKIGQLDKFNYVGWAAATDATDKTGYIKDAANSIADLKTLWESLPTTDTDLIKLLLKRTDIASEFGPWLTLATEIAALEANEKFNAETTFDTYKPDSTAISLNAKQAMNIVLEYSIKIKNNAKWEGSIEDQLGYMNMDNCWKESAYLMNSVEFLKAQGVTLPTFLTPIFTDIKYDAYVDAYQAIFQTIKLAQSIKDNSYTSVDNLTDAELATLNAYWTKDYTISSLYSWNWDSGNKFEAHCSGRVKFMVLLAGGTLTDGVAATDLPDGTPLLCKDYFKIVADFLESGSHTVKANGWGTETAEFTKTATPPVEPEDPVNPPVDPDPTPEA